MLIQTTFEATEQEVKTITENTVRDMVLTILNDIQFS